MDLEELSHKVRAITAYAADAMLKASPRPLPVAKKPDGSPVTDLDVAINTYLTDALTELLPGSAVLGEEGSTGPVGDVPTWVIDPIDGTSSFIAGLGLCTVAVALVLPGNNVPVLASVADPWTESYFHVTHPGPSQRGNTTTHVSDVTKVSDAYIAICVSRLYEPLARHGAHVVTSLPSVRMGAAVADGRADALVFSGAPWDVATTIALVTAAGGVVLYRTPPNPLGAHSELVAASTQELADAILDVWNATT
jgi:fructose-1,6-bisphosphatase/inositol monophosphatase family enzyme